MEYLLFGIISLLITFPIVYFLPVGFTKKGKILILSGAFIVFMIGLAARAILSVWQTGIVLILLAIVFTYIIATRFGNQLFEKNEYNLGSEDKVIRFELEEDIEEEIRSKVIQKEDDHLPSYKQDDSSSLSGEIIKFDEIVSSNSAEEIQEEEQIETIIPNIETFDEHVEMNYVFDNNQELNNETVLEDLIGETEEKTSNERNLDDLLNELELELNTPKDKKMAEEKPLDETEIHEQKMINLDEIEVEDIDSPESEPVEINIDSLQVENEEQFDGLMELYQENSKETQEVSEKNSSKEIQVGTSNEGESEGIEFSDDDVPVLIDSAPEPKKATDAQDDVIFEMEEIVMDEIVTIETQSASPIENIEADEILEDTLSMIDSTVPIIEESYDNTENQERTHDNDKMKQILFHTMVSQIKLSRNQLASTDYEKLILDHLHPKLTDHDYYTFLSLLIEHYVKTKQYDELSNLVSENKSRFEKYPVILQEINFLLKEYCNI